MYTKQFRSIVEFAVPVWQGNITLAEKQDIERVQKVALHIILGDKYENYRNALKITKLDSLEARRKHICTNFARKAEKNTKHRNWFKLKPNRNTRKEPDKYWNPIARTNRLTNSPICYLTRLLNNYHVK